MDLFTYVVIFAIGALFGAVLCLLILLARRRYTGVIRITQDPEERKTIYSLDLFEDPEDLIFKKKILFKVDTSEEEAVRE